MQYAGKLEAFASNLSLPALNCRDGWRSARWCKQAASLGNLQILTVELHAIHAEKHLNNKKRRGSVQVTEKLQMAQLAAYQNQVRGHRRGRGQRGRGLEELTPVTNVAKLDIGQRWALKTNKHSVIEQRWSWGP